MKIDETNKTVRVSRREFDSMYEYSCSLPTGTTLGKYWKCHNWWRYSNQLQEIANMAALGRGYPQWSMGMYVELQGEKSEFVGIRWYEIIIEE